MLSLQLFSQTGGDFPFVTVEDTHAVNESGFECVNCPKLAVNFEYGDRRKKDDNVALAGLAENISFSLDSKNKSNCKIDRIDVTGGAILTLNLPDVKKYRLPLREENITFTVFLVQTSECSCEPLIHSIEVVAPTEVVYILPRVLNDNALPGDPPTKEIDRSVLWHRKNRPSNGYYVRTYLKPAGVSFSNLLVGEGLVGINEIEIEDVISGEENYFEKLKSFDSSSFPLHEANQPKRFVIDDNLGRDPVYNDFTLQEFNKIGLTGGGDKIFAYGLCTSVEQVDASLSGKLVYKIPQQYVGENGELITFSTSVQTFEHNGKSKVGNGKSRSTKGAAVLPYSIVKDDNNVTNYPRPSWPNPLPPLLSLPPCN